MVKTVDQDVPEQDVFVPVSLMSPFHTFFWLVDFWKLAEGQRSAICQIQVFYFVCMETIVTFQ